MDFFKYIITIIVFISMISIIIFFLKKGKTSLMRSLPFLSWQFFMVIPFILQSSKMEYLAAGWQALGIQIINLSLFFHIIMPEIKIVNRKDIKTNKWIGLFKHIINSGCFYMLIFLAISVYHIISLKGNIPLLMQYNVDSSVLSQMRENAGKLLDVPFFMKYFFRWTTNLIAPIAIISFWNARHYFMAGIQLVLAMLYAMITTAKANLLFFFFVLAVYFWEKYHTRIKRKTYVLLAVFLVVISIRPIYFFVANPYSGFNYEVERWSDEPLAHRMQFVEYPDDFPRDYKKYNYVLRRMILTPSAVSHEWYSYIASGEEKFGYGDLMPTSKSKVAEQVVQASPANIVGLWAYSDKWPEKIGETISANASADADAYARGGWIAVAGAAVLLFVILQFIEIFRQKQNYISEGLYTAAICIIVLAIPSASVHAMLIAQGILPIMIGMFIIYFIDSQPACREEY